MNRIISNMNTNKAIKKSNKASNYKDVTSD